MKIKALRNKADRLFQEVGRTKYNSCLICGGQYSCLHHYFPKSTSSALRYNIDNAIPICQGCHFKHHNGNPTIHSEVLRKRGFEWENKIKKEKEKVIKISQSYYKQVIDNLKKQIEDLT